jgi:hypothetical protein
MLTSARRSLLVLALLLPLGTSGCRTRLLVSEVARPDCDTFVDGIPFRVRETHTIRVFQWHGPRIKTTNKPEGAADKCVAVPGFFQEVLQRELPFPNQHRLFALNIHAENFADATLDLTYFPDNTLRKAEVKGTPNAEGFTALGGALNTAGTKILQAESDIDTKVKAAQTTQDSENATALDNLLAYFGALNELQSHCTRFEFDMDSLTPPTEQERTNRQGTARTLLKDVIVKAAKAKLPFFQGNPFALTIEEICVVAHGAK